MLGNSEYCMASISSASDIDSARSPSWARSPATMKARAVMSSGSCGAGIGGRTVSSNIRSTISCSDGVFSNAALGTPTGCRKRLVWRRPGNTSYWVCTSSENSTVCGWVSVTWNASRKASMEAFQFDGSTLR
ncbi:hypothetical protein FQZ97_982890 [compost metagenome]